MSLNQFSRRKKMRLLKKKKKKIKSIFQIIITKNIIFETVNSEIKKKF